MLLVPTFKGVIFFLTKLLSKNLSFLFDYGSCASYCINDCLSVYVSVCINDLKGEQNTSFKLYGTFLKSVEKSFTSSTSTDLKSKF